MFQFSLFVQVFVLNDLLKHIYEIRAREPFLFFTLLDFYCCAFYMKKFEMIILHLMHGQIKNLLCLRLK